MLDTLKQFFFKSHGLWGYILTTPKLALKLEAHIHTVLVATSTEACGDTLQTPKILHGIIRNRLLCLN